MIKFFTEKNFKFLIGIFRKRNELISQPGFNDPSSRNGMYDSGRNSRSCSTVFIVDYNKSLAFFLKEPGKHASGNTLPDNDEIFSDHLRFLTGKTNHSNF